MPPALRHDNRLFLAADPPAPMRGRLAELAREAAARWGGRAGPEANLPLTLCFLGRVDPAAAEPLAATVRELGASAHPAAGRITGLAPPPGAGPARLCVAEIADAGGLAELIALGGALVARAAGRTPGTRPPWPHVTLVRFRRPTPLVAFPSNDEQVFVFDRVSLYDAHTVHGGPPRYIPVTGTRLGIVHSP